MKNFTISAILLAPTLLFGQVTLQSTEVNAEIGEAFHYESTGWFDPGSSGPNETWDLSNITSNSSSVLSYNNANPNFPSSNIEQSELTGGKHFIEQSNSGRYIHGSEGSGVTITYSNPLTIVEYPLSYGSSGNDTHYATFVSGGYNFVRSGSTTYNIDGWGTVITPNGTYTDVLRVRSTQTYTDNYALGTVDYDVETYEWYKSGIHFPVASLTSIWAFGLTEYGTYYTGSVGLEENNLLEILVYPNPMTNSVNVQMDVVDTKNTILVKDILGKVVLTENINSVETTIDTSNLERGLYSIIVVDENSNVLGSKRITK